jgi:hypothetical protein
MRKYVSILCLLFLLVIGTPFQIMGNDIVMPLYKGVITQATGRVNIKKVDEIEWTHAFTGFSVGQYDTIKIEDGSSVDIEFDKTYGCYFKIRLQDHSKLTLTSLKPEKGSSREDILLDLAIGDILIKVENLPPESHFRVRTPTSMVGVRGTRFRVRYGKPKE